MYKAVQWINDIISIEQTRHNIPPERIIIGGLSQGGALALLTSITTNKPIAGLFALSTYVPLRGKTPEVPLPSFMFLIDVLIASQKILTPFAKQIPIFWGHGKADRQVDYEFAIQSAETLASHLDIPFRSYEKVPITPQELEENSVQGSRFYSYGTLGHWVNERELEDLFAWILFILPDVSSDS